jgi:hypothetical protein
MLTKGALQRGGEAVHFRMHPEHADDAIALSN